MTWERILEIGTDVLSQNLDEDILLTLQQKPRVERMTGKLVLRKEAKINSMLIEFQEQHSKKRQKSNKKTELREQRPGETTITVDS